MSEGRKKRQRTFLGDADEDILCALALYQSLTTAQLLRALGRTGRPDLSTRLTDLERLGYLLSEPFRLTFGSPNVYVLTARGKKYLAQLDIDARVIQAATLRDMLDSSSMPHTLAVNDALIAVTQLPRIDPTFAVHTLLHDYHFKQQPLVVDGKKVIPDGWVELHKTAPDGSYRFVFALEVQHRGHMTTEVIRAKVRNYMALVSKGVHQAYFADPKLPLVVLFLMSRGDEHVRFVKQAIEQELQQKQRWAAMFYVAPFTREIVEQTSVYQAPVWERPFTTG